ncbi:hypothetical protein EVJ58_g10535 [Rhodofomes roseus]|uniref:RNase H type-1 domain-containing protein n=1 Tax=Rhodofomes roseus TaxID=34475 RepID=A0A4Y9XN37_9APHY|nr:hypothetical protein EVJ58_g10535 [Rhodofomes roseus]
MYSDGSLLTENNQRRVGASHVAIGHNSILFGRRIPMSRRAEVYDAEMAGLSWAARDLEAYLRQPDTPPIHDIFFFADNTSAISAIFEAKPGPSQGHSRIFREVVLRLLEADPATNITIAWTPGHKGITGNELADQLAKDATAMQPDNDRSTCANALRRARERAMEAWTEEWKQTRPTGRFATANRLPPKPTPRKRFTKLPRELFGRVLQCRSGHGFMGEYYRHHVPSETVECPCGAQYQSRSHILQDCPRYEAYRHLLRTASETIDLPTILGTDDGIDALARFIEESGAFTKTGEPPEAPEEGAAEQDDDEEAAAGDDRGGDDSEPEEEPDGPADEDEA